MRTPQKTQAELEIEAELAMPLDQTAINSAHNNVNTEMALMFAQHEASVSEYPALTNPSLNVNNHNMDDELEAMLQGYEAYDASEMNNNTSNLDYGLANMLNEYDTHQSLKHDRPRPTSSGAAISRSLVEETYNQIRE